MKLHSFADDTQLYRHTTIRDVQLAKRDMITAIMDINAWSHSHRLKLNAQKSKVIWLGTRQQLAKLNQADMTIHLPDGALTANPLSVTLVFSWTVNSVLMPRLVTALKVAIITYDTSTRSSLTLTKNVCAV